jgi:cytidyltransferase-like protein
MKRGIVSGYWNPLHGGHIDYIQASKAQCDYLIVIVNNDEQVKLKGSRPFMDEVHRFKITSFIKGVDEVIVAIDKDKTVCQTLALLRTTYPNDELLFFNSGDRVPVENSESSERKLCRELGIKYVAIPLPKVYSSSTLLAAIS